MEWLDRLRDALAYIEANLTEDLRVEAIAAKAHVSPFYFQRIFSALCGVTLGEYIRLRRLTLAGEELSCGNAKVMDVALRYGYESPESFARAFQRFHGIAPSRAKEKGARLNAYAPVTIHVRLEGGNMLEYKIVEKPAFTLMGIARTFSSDTSYSEIPKFWEEHMRGELGDAVKGMYGVCMDSDGKDFEYLIADDYIPWKEVPQGCRTHTFPAGTWAVFPCRGPLPKALQDVNTRVWGEWLPNCREYRLGGNYNIEMYTPPKENPEEDYNEIWLPVVKA